MTVFAPSLHWRRFRRMRGALVILPMLVLAAPGCSGGVAPGWGGAQVVPARGVVFASPGGKLYSLNPERRAENPNTLTAGEWQFPSDKHIGSYYAPPAVANSAVFAATSDGRLHAVDGNTGQQLWEFPPPSGQPPTLWDQVHAFTSGSAAGVKGGLGLVMGAPTVVGESVYVGGSNHWVYALDVKTGAKRWEFQAGDKVWSSPAVAGDTVYFGSLDHRLYAVDAATGARRWVFAAGGTIASSPLVVKDTVYIGAADRKLYALDAATGDVRWTFTAENWFWTRPAVGNGVLYAGALDHRVYALDLTTGRQVWPQPFQAQKPIVAAPVVVGDTVVVAAGDGTVYGLNARQGNAVWTYTVPNQVSVYSDLVTDGSVAYVTAVDNHLYALDLQTGRELWQYKGG